MNGAYKRMNVLVSGATGYIGGRLIPALLQEGFHVKVLVRSPEKLRDKPWVDKVEVCVGDAFDKDTLVPAMQGVEVAYFLLHSLSTSKSFEQEEANLASNFSSAAKEAGVRRIIYLGGLINKEEGGHLSPHLRSREHTGEILRDSGVETIELRAAVIIGSGSASFEMLRYLTERLPAMTTPKWVRSRIQPISVRDVVRYLVAAASLPTGLNRSFDIGGPDVLTYEDMMRRYAKVAGLRSRLIVPVPVLSPGLSSHWVGFITPVPASIARPLVESLKHEVICLEDDIKEYIPDPAEGLLEFEASCRAALAKVQGGTVVTRWADASVPGAPSEPWTGDPTWSGGTLYEDTREILIEASVEQVWGTVSRVGGDTGWYSSPVLWRVRGRLDRFVGGVGLRRGRRDPNQLWVGDAVDFWRVEACEENHLLRLRAEMKLPGLAWLEFTLTPEGAERTRLMQRALYHPIGLWGILYWKSIAVFHNTVFGSMVKNIKKTAEQSR